MGYIRRFSELKNAFGEITPKILSERLKELEDKGIIVKRVDAAVFPVKCEYALTDTGLDLINTIRWIKKKIGSEMED